MNRTDADKLAYDWFVGVPGLSVEIGFEIVDRTQHDFDKFDIRCSVFSTEDSKMADFVVNINDGDVICVNKIIDVRAHHVN